ncbi:type IV toxin-antitoxin system AbiEi family antitoxin domain-containing protein [Cryobacterium serini]|uniref:Type IV toxin-antitoxin system AbiEi family antitoxin domain-containing protein n=1 Tax=Cryobacterium serini TaxID=1259201 RepID=A0A4R9BP08_9MICO|nr:type IV toxin-antitoxin system AbiEi family antitoxin domain-containing protein [Cryobacterium serini]TFD88228.1 hypothetical protein E3T51_08265 [Cryobacterium serini]
MREVFETCDALYNGLIPAEALRASGMNSHTVDSLLKCGELVRVSRGWYTLGRSGSRWVPMGGTGSSCGLQLPERSEIGSIRISPPQRCMVCR